MLKEKGADVSFSAVRTLPNNYTWVVEPGGERASLCHLQMTLTVALFALWIGPIEKPSQISTTKLHHPFEKPRERLNLSVWFCSLQAGRSVPLFGGRWWHLARAHVYTFMPAGWDLGVKINLGCLFSTWRFMGVFVRRTRFPHALFLTYASLGTLLVCFWHVLSYLNMFS